MGDLKDQRSKGEMACDALGLCLAGVLREDSGVGDLRLEWSENDTGKTQGGWTHPGKREGNQNTAEAEIGRQTRMSGI